MSEPPPAPPASEPSRAGDPSFAVPGFRPETERERALMRDAELRFIALVHDALKFRVRGWLPRTGENHHAVRARRLAERYTADERLLAAVEQHDRPYGLWRKLRRTGRMDEPAFDRMLQRIPDLDLFVRFVELDGSSEAKNPAPIAWLKEELARRPGAA